MYVELRSFGVCGLRHDATFRVSAFAGAASEGYLWSTYQREHYCCSRTLTTEKDRHSLPFQEWLTADRWLAVPLILHEAGSETVADFSLCNPQERKGGTCVNSSMLVVTRALPAAVQLIYRQVSKRARRGCDVQAVCPSA